MNADEFWEWFEEHKDSVAQDMASDDPEAIRQTMAKIDAEIKKVASRGLFCFWSGRWAVRIRRDVQWDQGADTNPPGHIDPMHETTESPWATVVISAAH